MKLYDPEHAYCVQGNNCKRGITGRLLYYPDSRNVQQVLEGPEEDVMRIWEKVRKDPRHEVLSERVLTVVERDYSSWMALHVVRLHQRKTRSKRRQRRPRPSQTAC